MQDPFLIIIEGANHANPENSQLSQGYVKGLNFQSLFPDCQLTWDYVTQLPWYKRTSEVQQSQSL